jgi:uncharacterized protein
MLRVDLAQLQSRRRLPIDAELSADELDLEHVEADIAAPLRVRLEAQFAGSDVLVRGRIEGEAKLACRRCLEPLRRPIEEDVTFLFRSDAEPGEAENIFPLPPRVRELDLTDAVREQVILALPVFAVCGEDCLGFCPRCGANRNETPCDCETVELDSRWSALRNLKTD